MKISLSKNEYHEIYFLTKGVKKMKTRLQKAAERAHQVKNPVKEAKEILEKSPTGLDAATRRKIEKTTGLSVDEIAEMAQEQQRGRENSNNNRN